LFSNFPFSTSYTNFTKYNFSFGDYDSQINNLVIAIVNLMLFFHIDSLLNLSQ
jgi:hypothetical protein